MLIQFLLSLAFVFSLWLVWRRERQQAVSKGVAWLWSVGVACGLIVVWYPNSASWIANFVGIGRGADLVVYLAIVLLFVLVLQLHVSHVRLERQLTKLVREDALKDLT
ncbi:MAG TPA: DUF2304 domain-containing protein [Verrucomicrobiae bacterium]|nr:DUF2304 domain-containing protein [Verrucomicrobiae bacterium]